MNLKRLEKYINYKLGLLWPGFYVHVNRWITSKTYITSKNKVCIIIKLNDDKVDRYDFMVTSESGASVFIKIHNKIKLFEQRYYIRKGKDDIQEELKKLIGVTKQI